MENLELLNEIREDLDRFARGLQKYDRQEASICDNVVLIGIRDLGNWIHDEGNEDEEDDDQMVMAPGEFDKYFNKFKDWARTKSWFDKVNLIMEESEKNWCDFSIILKS